MKTGNQFIRSFALSTLTISLLGVSNISPLHAAAYKPEFQSVSVLGDSGGAAVVEDASTSYYNPAGLVDLPLQYVGSVVNLYAPTVFRGTVNAPSTLNAIGLGAFASNFNASGSASSHPDAFLPAMHLSIPMTPNCIALGFSLVPGFGFVQDYGEHSILRYNLTEVYTRSLQLSGSLAWRINSHWSIGLGPDAQWFTVQSKTHVRTQSVIPAFIPTAGDSRTRFTGSDWSYGGHIGILYRYDQATRFGLTYRSKLMTHLKGYSSFTVDGDGFFENGDFRLAVAFPATWMFSFYRDINPCWAFMGTFAYDEWSSIQNYHAEHYITPPIPPSTTPVLIDVDQPQKFRNTFDASFGVHYTMSPMLMWRASIKYVDTPTKTRFRYVTLPEAPNKVGIHIGGRLTLSKQLAFDFIYGHVFIPRVRVHDVNPLTGAVATGRSKTTIDFLGGQMVWTI